MPPFSNPSSKSKSTPQPNIVTLNVGGQIFQTTQQTLALAGPHSILAAPPPFLDRDPDLFAPLLSLLRTGAIASADPRLLAEARFYGLQPLLLEALAGPARFDPFALRREAVIPLPARVTPSALAASPDGSLFVAHAATVAAFDPSLSRAAALLTGFTAVDSLLALSSSLAAAGATDFSGLQLLDVEGGVVAGTLTWEGNATGSSSTVQAIGASPDCLFTSFESGRRNANSIVVCDRNGDLRPLAEIAHYEIYGADLDSAIPATKLSWIAGRGLLMASGSHSGPSGVTGSVKLWDIRSGKAVWAHKEKTDCFADITVSDGLSAIFKVGVSSGEVFHADIRNLGMGSPWVCLGDGRKAASGRRKEGVGCKIESHGDKVFCSRGGDLEMWSEVLLSSVRSDDELDERVFRRNNMGGAKDAGMPKVTHLAFGGNKMFVTRKDQLSVEVWESEGRGL